MFVIMKVISSQVVVFVAIKQFIKIYYHQCCINPSNQDTPKLIMKAQCKFQRNYSV